MRKEEAELRRAISVVFLLLGFFFLFHSKLEKLFLDHHQEELIEAFESLGSTSASGQAILASEVQISDREGKLSLLNGARGILRIPKIDFEMVIFDGTSEDVLGKGIGMIEPHKEIGINNVGLAGHRSTTFGKQFNRLDELEHHDILEVKTEEATYEFEVVKTFIVDRTEVEVLEDANAPLLTLVTCTPAGVKNPTDRLIVQAKLITER